jgi:hypothetical protein
MGEDQFFGGDESDDITREPNGDAPQAAEEGGVGARADLQNVAANVPYYKVQLSGARTADDETLEFGGAQTANFTYRATQDEVKALGTTTLWVQYDVPTVDATITQNLGFGDPAPLLLGQDFAGAVAAQTTPDAEFDLPQYELQVDAGGAVMNLPRAYFSGVDITARVGAFATADWRFEGFAGSLTNTALSPFTWDQPQVTSQAAFVRHGGVHADMAGLTLRVQSVRITMNMGREPLKQLGTYEPFVLIPTFPITVNATVEAFPVQDSAEVSYTTTGNVDPAVYGRPTEAGDADIIMRTSEGHFGSNAAHDKCTFRLPDCQIIDVSQAGNVGGSATITYTLRAYDLQYKSETA